MSHTPPIPAGNQSPYPRQEPPHKHESATPPSGDKHLASTPPQALSVPTLIALAAGVAAAVAGGLFYAFGSKPKPKRKKRKAKHEG